MIRKINAYVLNSAVKGGNTVDNIEGVLRRVAKEEGLEIEVKTESSFVNEIPDGYDVYFVHSSDASDDVMKKFGALDSARHWGISGVAYDEEMTRFNEDMARTALGDFLDLSEGE